MVSNYARYNSRYDLYRRFKAHMLECGGELWTCEVAFGDRPHVVTECDDPHALRLRTTTELWIKERALLLLAAKLTAQCPGWKYLIWADADIHFPDRHWIHNTVEALQHYSIVQCFQQAIDLGPSGEQIKTHNGFAYSYREGRPFGKKYQDWHSGFCWGIRRDLFDKIGFVDWGILGSADRYMASGLIGKMEEAFGNRQYSAPYWAKLMRWQELAEKYGRRNMGYVPGILLHEWHGRKSLRRYGDRFQLIERTQFDPDRDIIPDAGGLWQFVDHGDMRSIELRDGVRAYLHNRNEDSIDLE